MKSFHSAIFLCIIFLVCCRAPQQKIDSSSATRDTILKQFVVQADSFSYFDTIDDNYRMLRAYVNGDTEFFYNSLKTLKSMIWSIPDAHTPDSCVKDQPLNTLGADEAYRFIFDESYSFYRSNITIVNNSGNIKMHFAIYKPVHSSERCRLISEFDKQLTTAQWDSIVKTLQFADFWGYVDRTITKALTEQISTLTDSKEIERT